MIEYKYIYLKELVALDIFADEYNTIIIYWCICSLYVTTADFLTFIKQSYGVTLHSQREPPPSAVSITTM